MTADIERRFAGIQKLYGQQGYQQIKASHICVIGIGGVGSWVAESLARSHINTITLIDLDHIAESNINRQLHAQSSSLGKAKVVAMTERIHDINPACQVHAIEDHLDMENITQLIHSEFDSVLDCVDQFRVKAGLIHHCKRSKIHCLTVGGAGGRIDPSRIQIADMTRSEGDALLAKTRKLLRTQYGFPRNIKRRFDVPCVFSTETLRYPTRDNGITTDKSDSDVSTGLSCATGFGSLCAVTATFGMLASAYVLKRLADPQRTVKKQDG